MNEPLKLDTLIDGGLVFDGSGSPPVRAEVGIVDDRIVAVGDLVGAVAGRRFNAAGKHVVPGFIDIHTHSDISVLFNPAMDSMTSQGVTTQVVGNCSLSLGLATDDDVFAFEKRWLGAHGARITWKTMDGHLRRVADEGVATNYVMLAGQGTIRKRTMGFDSRPPTPDEMAQMQAMLAAALEDGAWGVSTGLEYTPSGYAGVDELAALSGVVARYGGFYATHLRNEGDQLLESVAEAIEVGERAGVPVQLSHHKAEGQQNWGKVHQTLALVEQARARGVDVQMDQYPYTAFQTAMSVQFLPPWAQVGDTDALLARLTDPAGRADVVADIRANHADWGSAEPGSQWDRVEIGSCRSDRSLQGRSISEIARERCQSPIDVVLDIIVSERNFVSAVNFAIDEEDVLFVMGARHTMIGSDAVGVAPRARMAEERVHPRCYGTFPRVLGRYVRERKSLSEAEAIHKMTGLPAARLGLRDRGRIATACFADIVVYDPGTVIDRSSFRRPHRFSTGIEAVLVNGRVAWEAGASTGALAGQALRRTTPRG
ncbi:MAG TPA: D-aminoacylase [Chthonomonadales bacterium]|nr:D-aminoacylase [Chthonomonadales bacterium]